MIWLDGFYQRVQPIQWTVLKSLCYTRVYNGWSNWLDLKPRRATCFSHTSFAGLEGQAALGMRMVRLRFSFTRYSALLRLRLSSIFVFWAWHITWLHTRARKYNLRVLWTYFECEGVKRTYLNLTCWPWKLSYFEEAEVRRQVWSTPHLRTHLTSRKWKSNESGVQRCDDSKGDWQLAPQVIYFVIKCKARFCKMRLEIVECTWVKCLLETLLASSVKPSIASRTLCRQRRMDSCNNKLKMECVKQ